MNLPLSPKRGGRSVPTSYPTNLIREVVVWDSTEILE